MKYLKPLKKPNRPPHRVQVQHAEPEGGLDWYWLNRLDRGVYMPVPVADTLQGHQPLRMEDRAETALDRQRALRLRLKLRTL